MHLFLIAVLFFGLDAASAQTSNVRFTTQPTISPDAKTIVFSYDSDLWKVNAEGGQAVRLTGMDGHETAASFSPDGKWLAFTSDQYGNNDVYVMPVSGGKITQLTFHQSNDQVESWSWDSKTIYFRSDRYNRVSAYAIPVDGGTPKRLFSHYHNNVHNLVEHPTENAFLFNESWESFIFPQRKRYVGPFNPDIKSYNTSTKTYTKLTDWEGKDFWPTVDKNGVLYFVSDRANGEYNLYTIKNGEASSLTKFNTSVKEPQVSANGQIVVFEKEYQIFTYDVAAGTSKLVPITSFQNETLAQEQSFDVDGNISNLDLSPDEKKMAFVSRGELFVSDADGKFIRQISTNPLGRVVEVLWMKDNKTLLFNQTVDGYQNWFTVAADGSGEEKQLTSDDQNNRNITFNSDFTKGVYLSGRNELRLLDLESLKSETIVTDEFWGFYNDQPRFSPDDAYILYAAYRSFEQDLFAYHIESKKTMNLTNTGVSESNGYWSPDGKYIYFASARTQPSYPRGGGDQNIYRVALDRFEDPYKSDEFDKLFIEKEESNDDEKKEEEESTVSVSINTEKLMQRIESIGTRFGSQYSPTVLQDGDKTHVLYGSDHEGGDSKLYVTTLEPYESPKTKVIDKLPSAGNVFVSQGKVFAISRGNVYKIDAGGANATKIDLSKEFNRNLESEFTQMFEEFWAGMEENFYNETFHGVNWQKIRDRYRSYLPYITSRTDLRRMNNDMLGELNSSHQGFSSSGAEENEFYSTVSLSPGLIFENDNPYKVAAVVANGPFDVAGKKVQSGDELIAIDGLDVDKKMNREQYFNRPKMQDELALTFKRGRETFTEKIHPVSYGSIKGDLYDEWVETNQTMVDEKTDKKVAYVHMKNMGGGELENFLLEMNSEGFNRDALILDLRYNTGGNVHDAVLQFLSQKPYAKWKYREGAFAAQPNFAPAAKPIVLLINEQSLSDAEVTAAGFKELGLGTIVGTATYRWIIFTSGAGLVDGSFYRLPSWGVYNLAGENLEKTGVEPDIAVDNIFTDRLNGKDPQLQKAIAVVLEQLK